MKIDSHVHFWKYDPVRDAWITDAMKDIQRDFLPVDVEAVAHRNGIDGVVAVQADQSELETHFLIELSKTHPIIKGVVGWIDLRSPDLEERLQYFSQYKIIKGWRHVVQGEPHDFLLGSNFQQGVAKLTLYDYTYDILIYHHQLDAAVEFVNALPKELKLIVDHCAKPDIPRKDIASWEKHMRALATHPNVYCKISGLLTEAVWKEWHAAEFYPYLDVVVDAFGKDRILFGSDWPVILVSGMYVQWKSLLEKYVEKWTDEEKEKFFGTNAKQFYSL